jgi:diguanylate cyclase (GGDEF)-like protein
MGEEFMSIEDIHRRFQQWIIGSRTYFRENAEANAAHNWHLLMPMSVIYLVILDFFFFLVCPLISIPVCFPCMIICLGFHILFTVFIILFRKKKMPVWIVQTAITVFGFEILAYAGYLELSVFPQMTTFLFPLCLCLMTHIYTRSPIYRITEIIFPFSFYLFFSFRLKTPSLFRMDLFILCIALIISSLAVFTQTIYIIQNDKNKRTLQKLCELDAMTGINNKASFQIQVEEYLDSHKRMNCALAICDLDNFKNVNDTYGHRIGDEVLQAFSKELHGLTDHDDQIIAGRFGGDEFVLFFKELSKEEVLHKLQCLHAIEGFTFEVTCSIGAAYSAGRKSNMIEMFDCADQHLYRIKGNRAQAIDIADID